MQDRNNPFFHQSVHVVKIYAPLEELVPVVIKLRLSIIIIILFLKDTVITGCHPDGTQCCLVPFPTGPVVV